MQEDKWVYQIGKDSLAVIFPLIGLAVSGGVAIALALANNDVDGAVSSVHREVPGG